MKFQANVPFKLTKMFYEKLGEQPKDKRVLVIRDLFTAMHASIDNAVTFITDDKEAYEVFSKNVVSNDEFGNDDTTQLVDTEINKHAWKDFINELTNMPKFDVAIMNPPYDGSLHLKILEKVIPIADKVVSISTSTWAAKQNINLPKGKYRKIFNNKIESFTFIPHKEINDIFGTGNSIKDGSIIVFSKNGAFDIERYGFNSTEEYTLFKKINFYSNEECITMSAAKNGKFGGTAEMFRTMKPKFYVPIYQWHGGKNCFDACVIQDKNKIDKGCSYFKFDSAQEQINFIDSLHTKFMDWFYYSFIVPGDYKEQAYLFRMTDYSKPWDDKRFCEYFGITGYIDDEHAEPNSEWEIILNTIK